MTKGVDIPAYIASNLIGIPDQVCEKVAAYQRAGVEHLSSLLFVGNTTDEMVDQIRAFAHHVIPRSTDPFDDDRAARFRFLPGPPR